MPCPHGPKNIIEKLKPKEGGAIKETFVWAKLVERWLLVTRRLDPTKTEPLELK
jgi:hypothetical protein